MIKLNFCVVLLSLIILVSANVFARGGEHISTDLLKYQFTETQGLESEFIEQLNQNEITDLSSIEISRTVKTAKGVRLNGLSKKWVERVVKSIDKHPVVSSYQYDKYNRKEVQIGFCFGRATYAHLALLKMGVNKDAIRKAWVVGSMKTFVDWSFHVTTLVKDDKTNTWWAVDDFPGEVLSLNDWYKHMKKMDSQGNLRLYVTSPDKFSVSLGSYSRVQLGLDLDRKNDWYQHYFKDMLDWFQKDDMASVGLRDLRQKP